MIQSLVRVVVGPITICLVVTVGVGCKQRQGSADVKADFVDQKPTGSQTWTDARTIALDEYAKDLLTFSGTENNKLNELQLELNESFRIAGVENPQPLSTYTVRMGRAECFSDSDYSIWWDSYRDQLRRQVEEVTWFVRDFHYAMLGMNSGAFTFREVVLCPESKLGSRMKLEGYQLLIGIPYSMGAYRPLTNRGSDATRSLKGLWESGAPLDLDRASGAWWNPLRSIFSKEEKARAAMRVMWKLFNPLSPVRVAIRKTLHDTGRDSAARLSEVTGAESRGIRESLLSIVRGRSPGGATASLEGRLAQLAEDRLQTLAANMRCFMLDAQRRGEIENSAVGVMKKEIRSESIDVEKDVRAGLVAVVNHHRVGVNVAVATGRYAQYVGVERSTRETRISTTVRAGLVAVDTSDDISVDLGVALDLGSTVDAAALQEGLDATETGRSLCSR